jgi:hypothetical protein
MMKLGNRVHENPDMGISAYLMRSRARGTGYSAPKRFTDPE